MKNTNAKSKKSEFEKWLETKIQPQLNTYIGTTNPEIQDVAEAAQKNCAGMQKLSVPFFLFSAVNDAAARKFARKNKIKAFVRVDGYFITSDDECFS